MKKGILFFFLLVLLFSQTAVISGEGTIAEADSYQYYVGKSRSQSASKFLSEGEDNWFLVDLASTKNNELFFLFVHTNETDTIDQITLLMDKTYVNKKGPESEIIPLRDQYAALTLGSQFLGLVNNSTKS